MQQIAEQGAQPITSVGKTLTVGKPTAGFTLFEAFAISAQVDARTQALVSLAKDGLSIQEFDIAVALSISHAKAADELAGFKAPEGAKGRDKYGPKQNTMVQRATEMRQIFGYLKLTHAEMHAGGYLETLKTARTYLKEKKVDWKGAPLPTDSDKAKKARLEGLEAARKQALVDVQQEDEETAGAYFERVEAHAKKLIEEAAVKENEAKIIKVCEGLVKTWDISDVYTIALTLMGQCIQSGYVDQDGIATDLLEVDGPDTPATV